MFVNSGVHAKAWCHCLFILCHYLLTLHSLCFTSNCVNNCSDADFIHFPQFGLHTTLPFLSYYSDSMCHCLAVHQQNCFMWLSSSFPGLQRKLWLSTLFICLFEFRFYLRQLSSNLFALKRNRRQFEKSLTLACYQCNKLGCNIKDIFNGIQHPLCKNDLICNCREECHNSCTGVHNVIKLQPVENWYFCHYPTSILLLK